MSVSLESKGQEPDFKPPGTEENVAVDQANTRLDAVYERLMDKLDVDGRKALKEAERSWIKWRNDEAMLRGRVGGAVGGRAELDSPRKTRPINDLGRILVPNR